VIDKTELKRIEWELARVAHDDGHIPSWRHNTQMLYDEVVLLLKENDALKEQNLKMFNVLKFIKSGIDNRFTDCAVWGRKIDEVLK